LTTLEVRFVVNRSAGEVVVHRKGS